MSLKQKHSAVAIMSPSNPTGCCALDPLSGNTTATEVASVGSAEWPRSPDPLCSPLPLGPRARKAIREARRGVAFLARHWLAVANTWFLLVLLGAVAVPATRASGLDWLADNLFAAYHLVCHQLPSRSFYLFGHQMAFCERDVAIYGSMSAAGIVFAVARNRLQPLPWKWYLASLIPIGIDGFTQLFGLRESNWELRLLTGWLFGTATVWLAYPHLERFAGLILSDEGL